MFLPVPQFTPSVPFHQRSVFIHSSTTNATQSQGLTGLLPNTLLHFTDLLAVEQWPSDFRNLVRTDARPSSW